jgi:hypothetical protein
MQHRALFHQSRCCQTEPPAQPKPRLKASIPFTHSNHFHLYHKQQCIKLPTASRSQSLQHSLHLVFHSVSKELLLCRGQKFDAVVEDTHIHGARGFSSISVDLIHTLLVFHLNPRRCQSEVLGSWKAELTHCSKLPVRLPPQTKDLRQQSP